MIRLGALGDVIRTLPAVHALRRRAPAAHITWLVEPAAAELVRSQAPVDDVLVFPRAELEASLWPPHPIKGMRRLMAFVAELRARRFDLVLDFHSILKSGLISRLSGARARVTYARPFGREGAWLFANHRAELGPEPMSRFERNTALVDYVLPGREQEESLDFEPLIRPDQSARDRMARALGDAEVGIVLHPGTSPGTLHKRWPSERHAALARLLAAETDLPILVSAGPSKHEQRLADAVVEASGGAARRAPATPDLDDLAALLQHALLFIGSDSGPLHLASLTGTPVLQIMGPTHPDENEPWAGAPWRRARVPLACSPCRRGCSEASCMLAVMPEAVAAEAHALLADRSRRPSPCATARVPGDGAAHGQEGDRPALRPAYASD